MSIDCCYFLRKLTLQNLPWLMCETDTPSDDDVAKFLEVIQQYISAPVNETVEAVESPNLDTTGASESEKHKLNRIRLNTKLKSQNTQ